MYCKSIQQRGQCGKILLVLLVIITSLFEVGKAQDKKQIDSLENLLKKAETDYQKVDILNQLSFSLYDFNDSLGLIKALQALSLSKKLYYKNGEKRSLTLVGIGYFSSGKYTLSKQSFIQSSNIVTDGDEEENHYNNAFLGNVYCDLGQYDSALYVLQATESDIKRTTKIRYLSRVYRTKARVLNTLYRYSDAIEMLKLAEASLVNNSPAVLSELYFLYFNAYLNAGNFSEAKKYATLTCEQAKLSTSNYSMVQCKLCEIDISTHQADYKNALKYTFEGIHLTKLFGYHFPRAQLYLKASEVYSELSEYELAASFAFKALSLAQESNMQGLMAEINGTLAWIFKDQKDYRQALNFVNESERIRTILKDKRGIANCYNTKGLIYMLEGDNELSISFYQKALQIRKELNYKAGIGASLFNLSLVYKQVGNFDQAYQLLLQGLEIDKEIGDVSDLTISYTEIATLLIETKKLKEAQPYADKAFEMAQQTQSKLLMRNAYNMYANYYEKKEDWKKAHYYIKLAKAEDDSIYSESISRKMAEMNALYDVEKKQQELLLLRNDKSLQETKLNLQAEQLRNQYIIIIVGTAGFILVSVFVILLFNYSKRMAKAKDELHRSHLEILEVNEELKTLNHQLIEKQEEIQAQAEELTESNETLLKLNNDNLEKQEELAAQTEELREANEAIINLNTKLEERVEQRTQQLKQAYLELDTFFYRSSHDFRRPLTTFMGLAEVAKITIKDGRAIELFDKVRETALSLDKMIRKLQAISDVGAQDLVLKDISVKEVIDNILLQYEEEARSKSLVLKNETNKQVTFKSYPALIMLIVENLVENAIQFCGVDHPSVKVMCYVHEREIILEVIDNGQGIQEEYIPKIYDMYFRANVSSRGNGLGLYIVRKALDKLKGDIQIKTVLHVGTTVRVNIPIS